MIMKDGSQQQFEEETMRELSINERKLLLAIGERNGKDISAHELGMTYDEFVEAAEELERKLLLDHWHLSEIEVVGIMGATLQSPTLTKRGEKVFKELRQNLPVDNSN